MTGNTAQVGVKCVRTSRILLDHGIASRWQFIIYMENKDGIYPQIQIGLALGVPEIFAHEGTCDGNNALLYGIRIEKDAIPDELIPYYLDYGSVMTEEECVALLRDRDECFLPHNEGDIVFNITSDLNVYFNFTNTAPAWCLGNLRNDPIETIVARAFEENVPALLLSKKMPLKELASRYGDPQSKKVFSLEDYKMYLLNRYLDEMYNGPIQKGI